MEAMLALFMRRACSLQAHRVARLVGNTDNHPDEFARQSEMEFGKLLQLQGDDRLEVLAIERLRLVDASLGMEGVTIQDLVSHTCWALPGCARCGAAADFDNAARASICS